MKQLQIQFQANNKDYTLTPIGFYALPIKKIIERKGDRKNENICNFCDARKLCIENKDNWCQKNRCMPHDVLISAGTIIKGRNEQVVFKKML